ncbi:MAG: hypothetical protein ACE5E7_12700 [Anaerolineae bacterium]
MKPLVYYCRWQGAKLRLRGRDETAVWGELIFPGEEDNGGQRFRFDLNSWQLTIHDLDGDRLLQLDEMGVVTQPDA